MKRSPPHSSHSRSAQAPLRTRVYVLWYNHSHMETTPAPAPSSVSAKTTPKDFFLWLLTVIALYGSISSLIALVFEYINYSFPDALASYGDPYGGAVRFSMAALIVLVPTALICLRLIRGTIVAEPGKAAIWVRRWALVLTLFIATATILIDLVTLINTFLGGEITVRFGLKVLVVLLVAAGVFMHFLADLKGYWIANPKKANMIGMGVGALALATILAGFFIIGTPSHIRDLKFDSEKTTSLQNIQYKVVNYYQQKHALPKSLTDLDDPLSGERTPVDSQTGKPFGYEVTGALSFKLCAEFNTDFEDTKGRGPYRDTSYAPVPSAIFGMSDVWMHGAGTVCFDRTIDPDKYPTIGKPN